MYQVHLVKLSKSFFFYIIFLKFTLCYAKTYLEPPMYLYVLKVQFIRLPHYITYFIILLILCNNITFLCNII